MVTRSAGMLDLEALHSNDTDFARFPRLRWVNPLR